MFFVFFDNLHKMGIKWSNQDDYSDDDFSEEDEEEEFGENPVKDKTDEQIEDSLGNICLDSATDTDAAPPSIAAMSISLNINQVELIENSLDVYEKVSVMYLLCDDPSKTLEQLTRLSNGHDEKFIYHWAYHENLKNTKWEEKLIEAICIIQNFEVLRILGLNREDLHLRFLPHHSFTFENVNKIRKCLYFMCEAFQQKDVTSLVSLVCEDIRDKGFKFIVYNPQFLELYLLNWEAIGYIKQDNLSNLCGVLKQIDQLDWYDKLKQLVPIVAPISIKKIEKKKNVVDSKKSKNLFEEILNPSSSLVSLASMESNNSADNAGDVIMGNIYDIDPKNPGVCLIINQENFYRDIDNDLEYLLPPADNKLEPRTGTAHDKEKLVKTFRQYGFKVIIADNLIHSDVLKKIEEVMKGITVDSSLFVCIMSHGDEGVIYGVNSCRVPVRKIKSVMCSTNREHLSGKPKVLILQSCQGTRCQPTSSSEQDDDIVTDGPTSSSKVPPWADLFTFWATVPGYAAIRNKKTGSWFIQSFCENIEALGDKQHFEDICTAVCNDVTNKKWRQTKEEVAMTPLKEGTFRKKFFLPPVRS